MSYEIWNRRYTGSKYKLADWIFDIIEKNCKGESFCDLFAGTGILAQRAIFRMNTVIVNDFLYSNEIIYKAFFLQESFNVTTLVKYRDAFRRLNSQDIQSNYISVNYGNKFFSNKDALLIGEIRTQIELAQDLSEKERAILLASLLYSADKVANTVGHYDAYIKNKDIESKFCFDLIRPYETKANIQIYRKDANMLAKTLSCDIVYIDPPYNSRQYSRFYHVLENITTWQKPKLYGAALKPSPENMSEYCRSAALNSFKNLINDLQCKYIAVSYNNTYMSRSSSSKNKMTLEQITEVLKTKGSVSTFEKEHPFFNAGKTSFDNHKELLFLVEVGK